MNGIGIRQVLALALASTALASGAAAQAQGEAGQERRDYDLPAQPLGAALRALSTASGRNILAPASLIEGRAAPALRGSFTVEQAVSALLAGSGLRARAAGNVLIIETQAQTPEIAESGEDMILVTGSRIRGAPVASPVIRIDSEDFRNQGRTSLGEVVRAIPQSFGGGQNPGIGINVPAASGVDIGAGSSINLRGLGSDATLTLLDGRRLAFSASRQSIDISAIPIGAVERIEIVPDGASALYGSDAVAGVANIILRRTMRGLELGAQIAATSDGGAFEQRYWATGGARWKGGGIVLAYEHGANSAILGGQRAYATRSPGLTLYPATRRDSATLAANHDLTDNLALAFDALFNSRTSETSFPTVTSGDVRQGRATNHAHVRSWAVAPGLKYALPGGWQLRLNADAGQERADLRQVTCVVDTCTQASSGFYRNSNRAAELGGEGALFALPAGDARIALGAGYRAIGFERFATNGSAVNTRHDQDSYYGFGEIELPLLAAAGRRQLSATGAVRYERYPGIGGVATPKFGLIASPTRDFDVKASWGKSFRAPTLYQQYQPRAVVIYPPALLGATGTPANAGALYVQGGNPALRPERATTWSATLAFHPAGLPHSRLELSYFSVAYRDRIVSPIAFVSQALSNPLYASQVTRNPSAALQADLLAGASTIVNVVGVPWDPANIVAIVDNASVNAGKQSARGIDLLAEHRFEFGEARSLSLNLNLSWLDSSQQISRTQPVIPLSGRIFSPPHWRGQSGLVWAEGSTHLAATLQYSGGVLDARRATAIPVRGMTTLDLSARTELAESGPLGGVELGVTLTNIFNTAPDVIAATLVTDTPYDSTNYSPVGRRILASISKRF